MGRSCDLLGALLGSILPFRGPPLSASWAPLGPPGGPPSRPGRPKKPQKHEKSTKTRKVSYFTTFQLGTPRFRSVWLHFGPPKRSQIEQKRWSPSRNLVFYETSRVHFHAFFEPREAQTHVFYVCSALFKVKPKPRPRGPKRKAPKQLPPCKLLIFRAFPHVNGPGSFGFSNRQR